MKCLITTILFALLVFPAIPASADMVEDLKCGCVPTPEEQCTCEFKRTLAKSGTTEFRSFCTKSDTDAAEPGIDISGQKNGTTCTIKFGGFSFIGEIFSTQSCTNWDPSNTDGLTIKTTCGCFRDCGNATIGDLEASLTVQQLPVPGGGMSECLWSSQSGTILSHSVANLEWQVNGNLVVYQDGSPLWASNTPENGDRLCFYADGNLVIYKNGLVTWNSGTSPYGRTLTLQTDCNLVVSDGSNNYLWGNQALCSNTGAANTGYVAGYIYGTNSNANNKCLQAQTDHFANGVDVHVWDQCYAGSPQKNRQWEYQLATGYIRNTSDPSFCLHKATGGFTVGDNIHIWKCDEGPAENKEWEYNVNGQNLIRSKANHNYCIFRGGPNVGDAIHLWNCNPNNNTDQNGRWNITNGESG